MIKCTERYSTGWTDARSVFGAGAFVEWTKYGADFDRRGRPLMKRKIDTHDYATEAKTLDIETCRAMWLVHYGDGWIDATELAEQDPLTWEIGNRLFWAGLLEHDTQADRYKCKS